MSNILDEANKIVNERSQEKEREYGSFSEGMERAAQILTSMRGKPFDGHDMFAAMIALKLSRQSFNFKTDNLLDLVAYTGAWQNYIDEQTKSQFVSPGISTRETDSAGNLDLKSDIKYNELIEYVKYLADNINKVIAYSEHIGEKGNEIIDYVESIAAHIGLKTFKDFNAEKEGL